MPLRGWCWMGAGCSHGLEDLKLGFFFSFFLFSSVLRFAVRAKWLDLQCVFKILMGLVSSKPGWFSFHFLLGKTPNSSLAAVWWRVWGLHSGDGLSQCSLEQRFAWSQVALWILHLYIKWRISRQVLQSSCTGGQQDTGSNLSQDTSYSALHFDFTIVLFITAPWWSQ